VLGPLGSLGAAATSVDDPRTRIVALLPAAEAALDSAATAATNAGTSLESSGQAARDGSDLLVQLATSMDGMSSAAQLSILGTQPFGALSQQLSAVAARSRGLATDLTAAADAIAANVTDSAAAAGRLHDLSAQIARLADELAGAGPATSAGGPSLATEIALLRTILIGLLLWLAAAALAAIWLGRRLRRDPVA